MENTKGFDAFSVLGGGVRVAGGTRIIENTGISVYVHGWAGWVGGPGGPIISEKKYMSFVWGSKRMGNLCGSICAPGAWLARPWFVSCLRFAKSNKKLLCDVVEDPLWFLDEFWWVSVSYTHTHLRQCNNRTQTQSLIGRSPLDK